MLASDSKVVINRGTREGVAVGQKFQVGTTEELVDEDTGEVLDVEIKTLGNIEVTEVKEKISYCTALAGVEKGMSILPVK